MQKTPRKTLPPDLYDFLELSALAFGGIGAGQYLKTDTDTPYCALGHVGKGERGFGRTLLAPLPFELRRTLRQAKVTEAENDAAVRALNLRHGRSPNARVTFKQWAKALNIVRGEH